MTRNLQYMANLITAMREENKLLREEAQTRQDRTRDENIRRDTLIREEAIAREKRLFLTSVPVKMYSGSKNPKKVQYFIDEIIRISSGFALTDEQKIIVAGRKMSGIAEEWYLDYQDKGLHQRDTFEEFGLRLNSKFGHRYDLQTPQAKLIACVQSGKVKDYSKRFYKILDEFPRDYFSEEANVANYLSNLKAEIRDEVKLEEPVNLGDAMKYARIVESKYTGKASWERYFLSKRRYTSIPKEVDNREIYNIASKKTQKGKVCFNCEKEGHFAARCPYMSKKAIRESKNGRVVPANQIQATKKVANQKSTQQPTLEEKTSSNIPEEYGSSDYEEVIAEKKSIMKTQFNIKESKNNSEIPCDVYFMGNIKLPNEVPIIRAKDEVKLVEPLLVIPVKIIDKECRALLASGAACNTITPRLVEELKLEKKKTPEVVLITATGERIIVATFVTVDLEIGHESVEVLFYVAELYQPIILGRPFTKEHAKDIGEDTVFGVKNCGQNKSRDLPLGVFTIMVEDS